MKRLSLMLMFVVLAAICSPAQQSLADAARQANTEKKANQAKHVYTNDDIAGTKTAEPEKSADTATEANGATATGDASAKPEGEAKADASAKPADKAADKADKKDSKAEAAAKADALKQKIAEQQKAVADQDHEISIMEREHQIRVAEYYADAGTQLRTSGQWFEDEKKYQEDLDGKKKALADAKAKLDDLNDQARKAGVPGS